MPANLYGVDNQPNAFYSAGTAGGVDVSVAAGPETVFVTSPPLIAPTQGWFYLLINGFFGYWFGAAPPGAINWNARFQGGSDFSITQFPAQMMVANGSGFVPVNTFTGPYSTQWMGAGSVVEMTLICSNNPINVRGPSTSIFFYLVRGPDH